MCLNQSSKDLTDLNVLLMVVRKNERRHHGVIDASGILAEIDDWFPALVVMEHGSAWPEKHLRRVL